MADTHTSLCLVKASRCAMEQMASREVVVSGCRDQSNVVGRGQMLYCSYNVSFLSRVVGTCHYFILYDLVKIS